MRMRLFDNPENNRVVLMYEDCDTGQTVRREFSAPLSRVGYVQELHEPYRVSQVCDRLQSTGNTLMASDASLPDVIRREYQAMRRAEKSLERQRQDRGW